jgi:uncharacterized Fe-S cluster protein YjdI/CDGSH-type Zn-finger protein
MSHGLAINAISLDVMRRSTDGQWWFAAEPCTVQSVEQQPDPELWAEDDDDPASAGMSESPADPRLVVKEYSSPVVTVTYDAARCRHFAECVRGLPAVFDPTTRPWIQPSNADAARVAEVIRRCPTGALQYRLADGPDEEPDAVTTMTALPGGPLLMRGDLHLTYPGPEQTTVQRTETRMAACSCGRSMLAPFCDGACHPAESPNDTTGPRPGT